MKALCDQTQQDWENSEAYRERMETAQEVAQDLQVYEQFYNAEAYHLSKAKELGYISLEAAQYISTAAIEKGLAKLGNFSLKKLDQGTLKVEQGYC